MVKGWAAKSEKTTAAKTDERRTSLTPKLDFVFANISKENARAGRMLDIVSETLRYYTISSQWGVV
jgi:hypothetical protein